MDPTVSSSTVGNVETIKEGTVAVRGHLMWRDRFVVVRTGEMIIRRRREGAIKAKIDLLDANVKLTFLSGQSLLTISIPGHDTVLDFRSSTSRDEWISAIVSAQELPGADAECDEDATDLLSEEEFDDKERLLRRSSTMSAGTEKSDSVEEDIEGYNDALLALQSVRDSVMQCHQSMGAAEVDSFITPREVVSTVNTRNASPSDRRAKINATRSEEELRWKRLRSLLTLIESSPHGGRVVLLHLGVVASAGISVSDILLALGEKQRDNPRNGSFTPRAVSAQKHHIAAFVRDILFHPIYSKREEVKTEVVQGLVDLFFPHCRLRRFSDDTPMQSIALTNAARGTAKSENDADVAFYTSTGIVPPSSISPPPRPPQLRKKRRNHSFPSLVRAKSAGAAPPTPTDTNAPTKIEEGSQRLRDNLSLLFAPNSRGGTFITNTTPIFDVDVLDDFDLGGEEVYLAEPLRTVLWEISCSEMAEQLTLFHHTQLSNVHPWEFLHHPKEAAKEMTDHFNRLVAYFVWSVLVEDTPKDRAEVIEDIISIAIAASAPPLNNFHLVMACVGCLGDLPLMSSRMPITWKKVRAKYKTRLTELRRLCDHSGGFENLRRKQSVESVRPPLSSDVSTTSIIPFIGVIGVMLERLRSINYFTPKKMLDLDKLERQYMTLNVLENALLKPPPRPSRTFQRGKATPTESAAEMTARVQHFFNNLNMDFATPRLHQLRSQQILANETNVTPSAASSFALSTANVNNKFAASSSMAMTMSSLATTMSSTAGISTIAESQMHVGSSESSNTPFASFRHICVLLVSVQDTRERLEMALEALFADDRQSATRFLHKFLVDFKQNVWIAGGGSSLQSIRNCVATLHHEVLTHKMTELMQISGLDENAVDLHMMVYEKIVALTVQPVYRQVVAKAKRTCATEDEHAAAKVMQSTPYSIVDSNTGRHCSNCSSGSPIQLLDLVCELVALPQQRDSVAATDHQLAAVELLGALQHQGRRTFLATHPVSSLCLLRQTLDPTFLTRERRRALEVFGAAVAWLRKDLKPGPQSKGSVGRLPTTS